MHEAFGSCALVLAVLACGVGIADADTLTFLKAPAITRPCSMSKRAGNRVRRCRAMSSE